MPRRGSTVRITLSPREFYELRVYAERRGVPPDLLLREAVRLMLCDGLIDAVIDDDNFVGRASDTRCSRIRKSPTEESGAAAATGIGGGPAQFEQER
jgi:hypothetical protein